MMSYQSFEEMPPRECLLLVGKSCTEPMALNVHAVSYLKSSFTGCLGKMESSICRPGTDMFFRPDLWPEELIDDITGWFDDLRGRWPEVEWWVHRIHGSSSSSRMAILQQRNYVLITRHDFETYDRNPHGLMELSFREPQLHTTVLPQMLNLPILRSFLAPLMGGIQTRLTLRASLNGITLDHRLIGVERGFYLLVNWLGNPHQVSQIEHVARLTVLRQLVGNDRSTTLFQQAICFSPCLEVAMHREKHASEDAITEAFDVEATWL